MDSKNTITINKNRGWRGLAEVIYRGKNGLIEQRMIFSFSQEVWDDMIYRHKIALQDKDNFIILTFEKSCKLPAPYQQRSVLIKNVTLNVVNKEVYSKRTWAIDARCSNDYAVINNCINNTNKHTTSEWNYVGVRVLP